MIYILVPVVVGCAIFFYRAAEIEKRSGILWTASSIALSMGGLFLFGLGILGVLLLQAGLFGAMWGLNIWKDRKSLGVPPEL